jgi:hypothetical protein
MQAITAQPQYMTCCFQESRQFERLARPIASANQNWPQLRCVPFLMRIRMLRVVSGFLAGALLLASTFLA